MGNHVSSYFKKYIRDIIYLVVLHRNISDCSLTEVISLFYSSSLPVPANVLQVMGPDDISEMSLTNNSQALNLLKLHSDGSNWSTYQECGSQFHHVKGVEEAPHGYCAKTSYTQGTGWRILQWK